MQHNNIIYKNCDRFLIQANVIYNILMTTECNIYYFLEI